MLRKKIFVITAVLLAAVTAGAQIKYKPLVPLPNDLDARVNYSVPDRSSGRAGDLCAIIKVVHSDMNFSFDIGSMVVNRTVPHPELGELWVYVPVGTNRIKISHAKYGSLDTEDGFYWFEGGLKCQSGQVYRLRLETGFIAEDEDIITDDTKEQKVLFRVTPANARIRLRKLPFNMEADGSFQMTLPIGTFHYRISAEDYYDSDGVVETVPDADTQTIEVALQHRQGLLDVQVSQSGATVKVDGQAVGTTPLELPVELNTGEHQVEVSCRNYRTESRSVMVEDGQTASVSFDLINTTMFTIDSSPTGSTLFINNENKGVTPYSIELPSGDYNIKLTKNKYKDLTRLVHLDSSQPQQNFSLVRIYQQKNSGYLQAGMQAGSLMAFGATLGMYLSNVNAEVSYFIGLSRSEDLYWNSDASTPSEPIRCVYEPTLYSFKLGYGIAIGTRIRITPQAGVSIVSLTGGDEGVSSKCHVLSGIVGARLDYAIIQGIGVFAAPEMGFAISKSSIYEQVAAVSSKVSGWGSGFNVRAGVTFFL